MGAPQARGSPSTNTYGAPSNQSPQGQTHFHSGNLPPMTAAPSYQQAYQPTAPVQPSGLHNQWYGPNLPSAGTTVSGPQGLPPQLISPPSSSSQKAEEWDDTYLAVLGTQDLKQLRELLARSNPEIIMPSNGPGPLSQAVILTLVHRVSPHSYNFIKTYADRYYSSQVRSAKRRQLTRRSSRASGGCSVLRRHSIPT